MSENRVSKWEITEDGYHKESRYVEYPSGKIRGYVRGCSCEPKSEWDASITGTDKPNIGSYVTEGLAKKAVEQACASLAPKSEP